MCKDGHVQIIHFCNLGTCITGLDDVGGRAVLAFHAETDLLFRLEIGAIFVNRGINRSELIATYPPPKKKKSQYWGKWAIKRKDTR